MPPKTLLPASLKTPNRSAGVTPSKFKTELPITDCSTTSFSKAQSTVASIVPTVIASLTVTACEPFIELYEYKPKTIASKASKRITVTKVNKKPPTLSARSRDMINPDPAQKQQTPVTE